MLVFLLKSNKQTNKENKTIERIMITNGEINDLAPVDCRNGSQRKGQDTQTGQKMINRTVNQEKLFLLNNMMFIYLLVRSSSLCWTDSL